MKSKPLLVEIVGPSGAGKTTLSGALSESELPFRTGINVWRMPALLLLKSAVFSMPAIGSIIVGRKRFCLDEIKHVIRLDAFYRKLRKEIEQKPRDGETALFFDEGIIFTLAKIRVDNPSADGTVPGTMRKWERQELDRWSKTLDAVVWLDAPNNFLIDRIRNRSKVHRMKYRPDNEVQKFLELYRSEYERIIDELKTRRDGIRIIRFCTVDESLDEMTDKILGLLKTSLIKH